MTQQSTRRRLIRGAPSTLNYPSKLTGHTHHIQHPPCNTFLPAMRKISQSPTHISRTPRTLPHHGNPHLIQTRIQQLQPICLPKIQPHLPRLPRAKQRTPILKLPFKLLSNFLPHRIATSPNTRPDCRHQILNARPILFRHLRHSKLDYPCDRSSPSRVKRSDYSLLHIHHQHGNAICCPHSQQNPRHICHQPIPLEYRLPLSRLQPTFERPIPHLHHTHHIGVNLPHSHQHRTIILTTNTMQKPPPILRY